MAATTVNESIIADTSTFLTQFDLGLNFYSIAFLLRQLAPLYKLRVPSRTLTTLEAIYAVLTPMHDALKLGHHHNR